jgi:Ribonuclease HII
MVTLRRSARLTSTILTTPPIVCFTTLATASSNNSVSDKPVRRATRTKKPNIASTAEVIVSAAAASKGNKKKHLQTLPRAREERLLTEGYAAVIGCDEAGRGPLAGPVVAAACLLPANLERIAGITDSKQIFCEDDRERLYEEIIAVKGVIWHAAVISPERIDEINILQATMQGMRVSHLNLCAGLSALAQLSLCVLKCLSASVAMYLLRRSLCMQCSASVVMSKQPHL